MTGYEAITFPLWFTTTQIVVCFILAQACITFNLWLCILSQHLKQIPKYQTSKHNAIHLTVFRGSVDESDTQTQEINGLLTVFQSNAVIL